MFYRRILTMSLIVGVFVVSSFFIYSDRRNKLREAEAYLAQLQHEKDEIMAQQDYYLSEISKLANDDYISMLARERYFKSLPDEIIFRISGKENSEQIEEN